MLTRKQILENRQKWIDHLLKPETKRYSGWLENPKNPEERCCLGHGCYVLGLERVVLPPTPYSTTSLHVGTVLGYLAGIEQRSITYCGADKLAPKEFVKLVGLKHPSGWVEDDLQIDAGVYHSLAIANDSGTSPQKIGEYLQSVIEGGYNTPFHPLTEYPE